MKTIQERLRDGADICYARNIQLDYARVVTEAADRIDALEAEAVALTKDAQADMFWNADDAETLYGSIDEFLNDEICNGSPLEVGDIRTIQRAIMLPKISIRITGINEEDCEADWEETAAQKEQA